MEEKHELNEFGETADQPEITGLMPDEKIKKEKIKAQKDSRVDFRSASCGGYQRKLGLGKQ